MYYVINKGVAGPLVRLLQYDPPFRCTNLVELVPSDVVTPSLRPLLQARVLFSEQSELIATRSTPSNSDMEHLVGQFLCVTEQDPTTLLHTVVSRVATLLNVTETRATELLMLRSWNVQETLVTDEQVSCKKTTSRLLSRCNATTPVTSSCLICCEDCDDTITCGLCDHAFCHACWRHYIMLKVTILNFITFIQSLSHL